MFTEREYVYFKGEREKERGMCVQRERESKCEIGEASVELKAARDHHLPFH